jgi:transcriptional regulator of acetoin/glycerol metabolism
MGFLAAIPVGVIAAVSAGSAAVGAGTAIAGGVSNANAQSAAGKEALYQSQQNAWLARVAGSDAMARGNTQAGLAHMQGTRIVDAQRAAFGGSGVDVESGVAQNLESSTETMSEYDAQTAITNARREAWGFKSQASQFLQQGAQAKAAADNAATGSLLTGFGQAAGYGGQFFSHASANKWWGMAKDPSSPPPIPKGTTYAGPEMVWRAGYKR